MPRLSPHVPVVVVLLLVVQLLLPALSAPPASAQSAGSWFVYHQITNLPVDIGTLTVDDAAAASS
jgi:hypothetical protein